MQTQNTPDYLPCPFCGSSNLTANQWVVYDGDIDLVECLDCDGTAPTNIWNNRSPMAEVAEIMQEVNEK